MKFQKIVLVTENGKLYVFNRAMLVNDEMKKAETESQPKKSTKKKQLKRR